MRRCSKMGLNRGPWTPQEDDLLLKYIQKKGEGRWRTLPIKAGLMRCGKSCRLRWMNYLRPDVKRGKISPDEEDLILRMHRLLGNRWSLIAGRIPGRTDNEIKNFWNTHLSKKLISQGIDPRTHRPLSESELVNDNEDDILSQGTSYENTYPQTANVLADKNEVAENNNSPGHLNATDELPEILGIPNHAFNDAPISSFQDSVYTCEQNSSNDNIVAMNQTFITHPNTTLEYEQDVLIRNTIHNSLFLPPALPDLICQENIPHQNQSNRFCSSIKETNPHKGFPLGFEQIEIQQHQTLPHATTEEYMHNSDIFSYFLEASMNDPQFNIGGTNKHAAAFLSEDRQRFSETELMNRIGYNLWSIIFPPL